MDELLVRRMVTHADAVVHLAASVGVNLIIRRPLDSLQNNIRGTEIVLEASADQGCKVMVASTSEIYGKNTGPLCSKMPTVSSDRRSSRVGHTPRPRLSTKSSPTIIGVPVEHLQWSCVCSIVLVLGSRATMGW